MATQTFFDKNAAKFDKPAPKKEGGGASLVVDNLVNHILKNSNFSDMTLMDFGTGAGTFGIQVVDRLKEKVKLAVFSDFSSEMLKKCQGNVETAGIDKICTCEYEQLDSGKDFPSSVNEKFDLIMSIVAFHHFVDPKGAMKRLFGALKPHGKLFILDMKLTPDSKYSHTEEVKKACNNEGNLDGFDLEAFKKDLTDVGFSNLALDMFSFTKPGNPRPLEFVMFVISGEKN